MDKFLSSLAVSPSWNSKVKEQYAEYENYITNYLPFYKQIVLEELQAVSSQFPEINFDFQIRIKSRNSTKEKVIRKLEEGKSGTIYDIFAHKIILHSIKGISSEKELIPFCYAVSEFLSKFDPNSIELEKKRKDYIANPKENNYQSIHLLKKHTLSTASFYTERQIKTAQMRLTEVDGTASHGSVYKNRFASLSSKSPLSDIVPLYLSCIMDDKHMPIRIEEQSFEESFHHFFQMSQEEYQCLLHQENSYVH